MKTRSSKIGIYFSAFLFLAMLVSLAVPMQTARAVEGTTVYVSNLQPNFTAPGGGGVYSGYRGPLVGDLDVSPGTTALYDGREAGIIKAGLAYDPSDNIYWDQGLFGIKLNLDVSSFPSQVVTYDVQNQTGTNPVWATIRLNNGGTLTTYQFIPTSNPAGWHTVDAAAGQWQLQVDGNGTGALMTLAEIATANSGATVERFYLRLGMGNSYNVSPGVGTVGWVDKVIIGTVTYDFVVSTWYVADDGNDANMGTESSPFKTIQKAIDVASDGDTIIVAAGTYDEKLTINKANLTLQSTDGAATTIIDVPDGTLTIGVTVNANLGTITMNGFTVKDFTESGIVQPMLQSAGTTLYVYNNIVTPAADYLRNGIQVSGNGSKVIGNHVDGAPLTPDWSGTGIMVVNGSNVLVESNTVNNGDSGISVVNWSATSMDNITIEGNTVDGADYAISIQGQAGKDLSNVAITNNILKNGVYDGIDVFTIDLTNLTITGNQIFDNGADGIWIDTDASVVLAGNMDIHSNQIYGNTNSNITNLNSYSVDASSNWWGAATGPLQATTNPSGGGNAVSANVTYNPWFNTDAKTTKTYQVGSGQTYTTIQSAVTAASSSVIDTVNVLAGNYPEQVTIAKPLTLTGADGAVLDGATLPAGWTTGVQIRSGNVTFNNIDVTNYTQDGITAYDHINMPNLHITNSKISNIQPGNWGFGIYVGYESEGFGYIPPDLTTHLDFTGLLIEGNEITNVHSSAMVIQSLTGTPGTLVVRNNNIHDNTTNSGIWVDCARNLLIENNTVISNKWGVEFSCYAETAGTLNGSYSPKDITLHDNLISNNTFEGIALYEAWPGTFTISGNKILGNETGINNPFAVSLNASSNWWGAASGPGVVGYGSGDKISTNVDYSPWCTNEACTTFSPPAPAAFSKTYPVDTATGRPVNLTLTWAASTGATGYEYCINTTNDTTCNAGANWVSTGTTRSAALTNLTGLTTYYWQVRASNGGGTVLANTGTWWTFRTTSCYTLTTLVSPTGSGTVSVTPPNCEGVKYQNGTVVTLTPNDGTGTFTSWSGSLAGSTHPTTITMNANKSVTANFTAPPAAFSKTYPVNAATGRVVNLTLTWAASAGATGYEYCINTTNDTTCNAGANWVSTGTTRSAALTNLTGLTTYYWQVRASNGGGTVLANTGTWWTFRTTSCYTLTTLVSPTGSGTVSVTPPNCEGVKYQNGTVVTLTPNDGTGTFTSWSGSLAGSTHPTTITMNANKSVTANFTAPPAAFSKTYPVNAATGRAVNLTLTWAASAGATGYDYCINTTNDTTCNAGANWVSTGTTRSAALTNLTGLTTYYWQVRASNGGGTVLANTSAWWSFRTTACYTLTTLVSPTGSGTVSVTPPNCEGVKYQNGTVVTLTPNAGSEYDWWKWTGSLTGIANPGYLTMNGNKVVTANFTLK